MNISLKDRWSQIAKTLSNERVMLAVWVVIGAVSALTKLHRNNNFLVFRGTFWHAIKGQCLYGDYPEEYFDQNYYGPVFSLIIAPFAAVPVWLGQLLWCVALAVFLYWAVKRYAGLYRGGDMRVTEHFVMVLMCWYCAHELLTALFMQQFNVAIAAIIVLAFVFVERERDPWAALLIMVGTMVKLYGIVGLAFFFFSKHKLKFLLWLVLWTIILFVAPMAITGVDYQLTQYHEWASHLAEKNGLNLLGTMQNISLLGMVRKIGYAFTVGHAEFLAMHSGDVAADASNWWLARWNDLWLILPAMLLMAVGYFRVRQWRYPAFRHAVLAGVLMFVVLFSTGSESSGYVIALVGCCVWFASAPWRRNGVDVALMTLCLVLSSFSPSDLFPAALRHDWVQPYALKALPVAIIWLKLCFEITTRNYALGTSR